MKCPRNGRVGKGCFSYINSKMYMAPLKENYSEVLQTPGRAKRSILLAVDTVPGQSILLLR